MAFILNIELDGRLCLSPRSSSFVLTRTRSDNDMYSHMNNSIYSFLYVRKAPYFKHPDFDLPTSFDSIVNAFLIQRCGLSPSDSKSIGLVVHSHCDYFGSVAFPAVVDLGLRVNSLGNSSVTYEIGVFERGSEVVRAVGGFVHVFVERSSNRPALQGMPEPMREGLKTILVMDKSKL